jgi:hypothetical protein
MSRKILNIVNCENENLTPQKAIKAIEKSLTSEGIPFGGVFYECKSKMGYIWLDPPTIDTPPPINITA